jgi:hypothetical protein
MVPSYYGGANGAVRDASSEFRVRSSVFGVRAAAFGLLGAGRLHVCRARLITYKGHSIKGHRARCSAWHPTARERRAHEEGNTRG